MMQAVKGNSIKTKTDNEKSDILKNLQNSYDHLSSSPQLKLGGYVNSNHLQRINNTFDFDSEFNKGKKHYTDNPNLQSNINLEFKENYNDPSERVDQFVNYYKEVGDKEKKYMYSPELYSFYNRDKADPSLRYNRNVRSLNYSMDHPNNKKGK